MNSRILSAVVAAAGILAFEAAKSIVSVLVTIGWVSANRVTGGWGTVPGFYEVGADIVNYLPFAAGVFVAFAWVVPPTATSQISRVILSGVVAAAIGAGAQFLVAFALWLLSLGGSPVVPIGTDPGNLLFVSVTTIVVSLPLTVLAAMFVREWLRSKAVIDAPKEPAPAV